MKKILLIAALCLTAAVLLCGCNTKTAPEAPEYLYVTYNLDGEEFITMTKYMGKKTDVVVPAELDGKTVTEIGEGCFAETAVVSVTVPDSILVIENNAFAKCAALTSVTLPEGLTTIGISAFYNCPKLESLVIPASVVEIQDYAFARCEALQTLYFLGDAPQMEDHIFKYNSTQTAYRYRTGTLERLQQICKPLCSYLQSRYTRKQP